MQLIVFCGIQGCGKTTFYRERFLHTHVRLSMDMLRTRRRELILFAACLEAKQPVVIDNTNPTVADRAKYIVPAKAARFGVIGYYFESDVSAALGRNASRSEKQRVPVAGVWGTYKRLQVPIIQEGFDSLNVVRINSACAGEFLVEAVSGVHPRPAGVESPDVAVQHVSQ